MKEILSGRIIKIGSRPLISVLVLITMASHPSWLGYYFFREKMVEKKYSWMVSREFYNQTPNAGYVACCSVSLPPLLSPLIPGGMFRGQLGTGNVP